MIEVANKEENKLVTLTVAECSEFHSMGEFHENIRSAAEAVSKFKEIPPERMHGIPAIGIRVADPKNLDDYVELDVLTGKTFDLDMLHYVPEIAENWQAQQMKGRFLTVSRRRLTGWSPETSVQTNCSRSLINWKKELWKYSRATVTNSSLIRWQNFRDIP